MSGVPPLDVDVQLLFDRARIFATTRISTGRQLCVRHLVAAILTTRPPLAAFDLIRRAGRTAEGLLAQFRRWLRSFDDQGDDLELWDRIFDELRADILAGYDNDEAHGADRLNIGPDVRALAAVLASTQVTPPLSLGLFGDWGSGKSFFMAQLRTRIEQLAIAARTQSGTESWFCGKRGSVVQIDFNAWHYMDANLWSSLAVRVFDELSGHFKEEFAKACVKQLESLKERTAELAAQRESLDASEKILGERLKTERFNRAEREVTFQEALEVIEGDVRKAVAANEKVVAVRDELQRQGDLTRAELERIKADLGTFIGTMERGWDTLRSPARRRVLALVLAAPAVVSVVTFLYIHAAGASAALLATIFGTLAGAHAFVKRASAKVGGLLTGALDEVDRIEEEARKKKTDEEVRLETERSQVATRISELEREQLALGQRKAELEAQIAKLADGSKASLKEFILERAAADDYRKHLGVVSAVHRDFKELARFLAPGGEPPHVERIVLYIDDLDRCPPERVVEVLQAVHILLSLRLFVVVVAVDSRWLLDSLKAYYRQQFPIEADREEVGRPQQYLEKIFQISFTLMPMSQDGFESLVGSLLQRNVDASHEKRGRGDADERRAAAGGGAQEPAAMARKSPPAVADAAAARSAARVDLTPRGLQLEPLELQNISKVARVVGSPRAAKRLVNLYRIVRAMLDDVALDRLVAGQYKIVQIYLALVISNPTFAAELFEQILSGRLKSRSDLGQWCMDDARKDREKDTRWLTALEGIQQHEALFAEWDGAKDAVSIVARFSFETGRVLANYVGR